MSLGPGVGGLHQQLGGVRRRGHGGAEQEVLMLGQVLGRGLLGCPCTVEQLPLQQREVGLERKQSLVKCCRRLQRRHHAETIDETDHRDVTAELREAGRTSS